MRVSKNITEREEEANCTQESRDKSKTEKKIYTGKEKGVNFEKRTDRQKDRQADRKTEAKTDRQSDRETRK